MSAVLPLDKFTEICQKVYFAVENYSDTDFIIANSYLYCVFSEHYIISGITAYHDYSCLLRFNLESTLRRLTLFLPATLEVIAALVLGVSGIIVGLFVSMLTPPQVFQPYRKWQCRYSTNSSDNSLGSVPKTWLSPTTTANLHPRRAASCCSGELVLDSL